MDWLANSIMHRRGVARGAVSATHELSEAKQGAYRYTIGPSAEPVLAASPGDRVVVETQDAFGGVISGEQGRPSAKLEMPFVIPQNGHIRVEGGAKGDMLAVFVDAIAPRGPQPRGTNLPCP